MFEVFGTTTVVSPLGVRTVVPARKPRLLLSWLLLHPDKPVSVDQLVDALWEERPPASAVGNIKTYVWTLRHLLARNEPERHASPRISSDQNGYRIQVARDAVDVFRFEDQVSDGCREWTNGEPVRVVEVLSQALLLWRGEPFPELTGATVEAVRSRLTEQRAAAHEHLAHALVALGRANEAVAALTGMVAEHPFREHLQAAMMTALHQAGRSAEALRHYQAIRTVLDRELGVPPCAELRRLHAEILRGDDIEVATAGPRHRPESVAAIAQLPAPPRGFVGRQDVLRALDQSLENPDTGVMLRTVTGTAGVGKTALVLHWAHRVRFRFPDGQLFVNLRGHSAEAPLSAGQALDELLQALRIDQAGRALSVDAAAAAYRSAVADRQMLIVLDDAADVEQVRPLLPGTAGCTVVITSRNRFDGLVAREGARQVRLDVLAPDDGLALVGAVVGTERVTREETKVRELAALCGGLPLALRIAAAHLSTHPNRPVGDYVTELRTGDRLAALEPYGDRQSAVRTAIDLSYAVQAAGTQRLFRLLGLVPGPDTTALAVAALADISHADAERGLRTLVAAHLVEEPVSGRYTLHELLRLYAVGRAAVDGDTPLDRLLGWYAATADRAADALDPGRKRLPLPTAGRDGPEPLSFDAGTALAWFTDEAANLAAAVRQAAGTGPRWAAWYIADAMKGFFLRGNITQWPTVVDTALRAADGDPLATAAMHNSKGILGLTLGDHVSASDHFGKALEAATAAHWILGQVTAQSNLGLLHYYTGPLVTALDHLDRANTIATDDTRCLSHLGTIRINLGATMLGLGRPTDAAAHLTDALTIQQRSGHDRGRGVTLLLLAETHLHLGDVTRAEDLVELASSDIRRNAIDHELARCHEFRARVALLRNDHQRAHELLTEAAKLAEGHHIVETDTLNTTATAHRLQHQLPQAAALYRQALKGAGRSRYRRGQVDALLGLSALCRSQGQLDHAANHANAALETAHRSGMRTREAQALTARAEVHLDRHDHRAAIDDASLARSIHAETGHRLLEAHSLRLLARAARQ